MSLLLRIVNGMWTKGSMKLKVLVAVSLLVIVPVAVFGGIAYLVAENAVSEEVGKANRETVKQVQERIDEKLITLDKIALQHAFNPNFKEFLSLSNPYENPEKARDVMTVLTSMEGLISDANAVSLYMTQQKLLVSPSQGVTDLGKLDPDLRKRLEAKASEPENGRPYFLTDRKSESRLPRGGSHVVTYVRKLPVSVLDQPMGYLIIELNDRAFFDVFSHMTLGSSGEMLIATPSGNIFSDWNKNLLGPDLHSPLIQKLLATTKPEDRFSEKIDGRTMLVNYLQSSYSGWKYISVLPVEELTGHFDWIKQMMIGLGLFLIAVSLLAVFWLSRSFFGLWHGLLELLRRGGREHPAPAAGRLNEFGLIRHYVETLHRTNDELEKQVEDSMPLLRTHFLRRVLNEAMKEEELGQRFAYYGLPMEGRYYAVMCLELDDLRGQTEQDLNLFGYAVNNIAREVISHHAEGAVFQTGTEQTAVILNLGGEETSSHDAQAAVFSVAEELHRVIGELLKVTVTIGIGRCYPCRTRIRSSYREAKEALEFQLVEGNDKVIFIGSVLPQRSAFFYPAEQELTVVTGLKLCRLEQIRQGTDQFAAKLTACGRQASVDHIQQSFVQLVAASLKTLFELDPEGGPKLFPYNLYQRLAQLKTGDAIVQWLGTEVYPAMVAHISGFRNQRQRKTMEKVLQFIHEHYDEDLSQPMLADLVSLPGSQFSSMFKEETGMTLTDYIIAYRMDRAKELLVTTDLKVGDIADRLSYNNAQNFIRVFKRICGITPGEYRTQHASSDRAG